MGGVGCRLVDVYRGAKSQKITDSVLSSINGYGAGKKHTKHDAERLARRLVMDGYLEEEYVGECCCIALMHCIVLSRPPVGDAGVICVTHVLPHCARTCMLGWCCLLWCAVLPHRSTVRLTLLTQYIRGLACVHSQSLRGYAGIHPLCPPQNFTSGHSHSVVHGRQRPREKFPQGCAGVFTPDLRPEHVIGTHGDMGVCLTTHL